MSYNTRDTLLPHGSDKCRCPTCGLYFNSTYGMLEYYREQYEAMRAAREGNG